MTNINRRQAWLLATRPKTLPAALAPVLVGVALALRDGVFSLLPSLAALGGALLLQIGVNLANDYFDYLKGVDSSERKGPLRVTQAGLIPPTQVRNAMMLVLGLAALDGLYLALVGGWPILFIGLAALVSALAYSGGPFPLASHGLGDLFVFIFFGLAAVCGSYYVQAQYLTPIVWLSAIPPGLLITAILVVNNLRDLDSDQAVGKNTLAVILGIRGSQFEYALLLLGAYVIPAAMWLWGPLRVWALLPFLTLPLTLPLGRTLHKHHADGPAMNNALAGTARLTLIFCLLFALGLILSL